MTKPMTDEQKLLVLADWIDAKYPNDPNPEVQADLRQIAKEIRRLREENNLIWAEVKKLRKENEEYDDELAKLREENAYLDEEGQANVDDITPAVKREGDLDNYED
jgi:chromosome segregation ATPase